ncbi:APC family permease [Priestia endophytica]|uniref:APC family permease n=1 Tax=Priestia endophytica TaxID=135735 RepID=UPI003D2BBE10
MNNSTKQVAPERQLRMKHVVAIGFAYMAPFAVFDTFGIVSHVTNGLVPLAYFIVFISILFTALSYRKLVQKYPISGSVYLYTKRIIHPYAAILVGWVSFIAYLALPMINALLASVYLSSGFPTVPKWVWVISLITFITLMNCIGIKIATTLNTWLVILQFIVVIVFIGLCLKDLLTTPAQSMPIHDLLPTPNEFPTLLPGAALLTLSFVGFDAITNLCDETIRPEKTIPKAIILLAIGGLVFFVVVTYLMQSLFPNASQFNNYEAASPEIAVHLGGNLFLAFFLGAALLSCIASGLASQLVASRFLYAMGRDGALPKQVFSYLHPRSKTPLFNILIVGLLAATALFLDLEKATALVNFGAFSAFTFVNICILYAYFKRKKKPAFFENFLFPFLGLVFTGFLWISLNPFSLFIGGIWTLLGIVYLISTTRFFKKAPVDLHYDELSGM